MKDDYEYHESSEKSRSAKLDDISDYEPPKTEFVNQKRGYSSLEKSMIEEWLRHNRPTGVEQ